MRWLAASALVVVLGQVAAAQPSPADLATFANLETAWNTAHVRGDADTLSRIFADDLIVIVPGMRLLNKADSLGMFTTARMKFDKYESSETQVRIYDSTALVTGRIRRTRTIAGKTMEDDWRFTKVYLRRSDNWQVVSFQASNITP